MVNILERHKHFISFFDCLFKTAGLAGLVCGANVRPNPLEGGGSCYEAEKPRSDSWNPRAFTPRRMSSPVNLLVLWLEPGNRYLEEEPKPSEN
jgi:hypothetical protein